MEGRSRLPTRSNTSSRPSVLTLANTGPAWPGPCCRCVFPAPVVRKSALGFPPAITHIASDNVDAENGHAPCHASDPAITLLFGLGV